MTTASIVGIATALPDRVLDNAALAEEQPDWDYARLGNRTGVRERRIAAPGETALDLGLRAAQTLLAEQKIPAERIDALLFCTETPDHIIPGNAPILHHRLALRGDIVALDLNVGCAGYVQALQVAQAMIVSGQALNILIVNADCYSRLIHPEDRSTRSLFGDGATATLVACGTDGRGIRDMAFAVDGSRFDQFIVRDGGARFPRGPEHAVSRDAYITMNGLGVLSFFSSVVPQQVKAVLERNHLGIADIDRFIFHQASGMALDQVERALAIPAAKMPRSIATLGNLVSASIPATLDAAMRNGQVQSGQRLLLCGFGVGLSWGTILLDV